MNQNYLNNSLWEFAIYGMLFEVKRCLELGADPKDDDSYALRIAARYGHLEVVKFLLPHSYPKARDSEALSWAAENGHLEVAKTIEDYIKENNL